MKLFEKTDLQDLRKWLDRRVSSLKHERQPHEAFWRKLAENFEPDLGRALFSDDSDTEARAAAARDAKLLTSTPRTELRRMAAAMKSGTANESRQWFRLRLRSREDAANENQAWGRWLDETLYRAAALLDQSNAYGAIGRMFHQVGLFGTAAGVVFGTHPTDILDIRVADTGSYWIASSRSGLVDVLLRQISMTAREILEEFGEKRAPDSAIKACENGSDETRYSLFNLICPNDPDRFPDIDASMPVASIWWMTDSGFCGGEDTAGIIDMRVFSYNPILCPRWDIVDGVYGTGPGRIALPDVLSLYRLEKDALRAIAQRVDPPLAAHESMRGHPINTYPGSVTYYSDTQSRDRSLHNLIDNPPDVQAVEIKIQQIEQRLRRAFYADLFNAVLNTANNTGVQMTARQVDEMSGEKISLLGPVLTNLNHGLFDPLINALMGVMGDNQLLPKAPESMGGIEFHAEYVSTLHLRQQEEARMGGIMRFMNLATAVMKISPSSSLKIDFDQVLDESAHAYAVPSSVIRSDRDVEKMRDVITAQKNAEQQALANAEIGKQIPGYAQAAKTLSETPTPGGNALETIIGATQQTGGGLL
jgi:hypothetical protein